MSSSTTKDYVTTENGEELLKDYLAEAFNEDMNGRPALDSSYDQLTRAVDCMQVLGLRSHLDRRLSELRRQQEYYGRVFYTQSVEISVKGSSCNRAPGMQPIPFSLDESEVWFITRSLDRKRALLLRFTSREPAKTTFNLTPNNASELDLNLKSLSPAYPALQLHRNGKGDDACHLHADHFDDYYQCRVRWYDHLDANRIEDAYNQDGQDGVFAILDKIWLDLMCKNRPMRQPLSQEALRVRHRLHQGHPIKIFLGRDDSLVGTLKQVKIDGQEQIRAIQIVPIGQKRIVTIAASEIMELLPCRPESEDLQI